MESLQVSKVVAGDAYYLIVITLNVAYQILDSTAPVLYYYT